MEENSSLQKFLSAFHPDLSNAILSDAIVKDFPRDLEILKEGSYVKVVPVVIDGLIKVFTKHEEKELLLYYIRPGESCIMSFSAGLKNEPSKAFAVTEGHTKALLLPVSHLNLWIKQYPEISALFFQQYNLRYTDLLDTINHILFEKLDKRLFDYLQKKVQLTGKNTLKISHRQMAGDLGTAREVITRVIRKLEANGKVKQNSNGIEIF
jgi:CRP/FNR family transcriptional regulator, anaerobic regulatory protein